MASLGSLVVSLAVDTARFQGDLGRAAHIAESRMRNIKDTAQRALGAITIMATAAGAALTVALKKSIDNADNLRDLAQAAGVTVEELSRLAYAGKQSGVEIEQISKALARLARDGAPDANAALRAIADRFAKMPDGAEKTALAIDYFGERLGPYLIPLLNEGADGLARFAEESDRVGNTVSTSAAEGADKFNDSLGLLKATVAGLVNTLAAQMLPVLNDMISRLNASATSAENMGRAAKQIETLFRVIVTMGYSAYGILESLGTKIGAIAAATHAAATGNFRQASEIMRMSDDDIISSGQRANEFLRKLWSDRASDAEAAARHIQAVSRGSGSGVLTRFTPEPGGEGKPKKAGDGLSEINVWQRQVFSLANAQQEALKDLNTESLRDSQAFMVQIGNSSVELTREIGEAWSQQYEDAKKSLSATAAFAEQMGADMRRSLADFLFDPFKEGLDGMLSGFVDMLRQMVAQIAAQQLLTSFFTWGSGLGGGMGNFFGGLLKGITGKAAGGPVMGGTPYLVGERGPELFVPRSSGTIMPNGAGGVVLNQSIHLDARGGDADRIAAMLPAWGRALKAATVAEVRDLVARGKLA